MKVDTAKLEFMPVMREWVDACAEIAKTAPDPWDKSAFERIVDNENQWSFVALQEGEVLGFACFLAVAGSADLQLLAVRSDCRRQGVASRLLMHALPLLRRQGVTAVLLEARVSNHAARRLYEGIGFKTITLRRAMYGHPVEDGVLMALHMEPLRPDEKDKVESTP